MIEIIQATKVYHHKVALDSVSVKINPGQVFGLIGPNGAGKTTLIRLLNQIISPTKGQIRIANVLLNEAHVRSFGYLPEERGLYRDMKVLEHLVFLGQLRGLSKLEAKRTSMAWIEKFQIADWKDRKINTLSKGMAQKVQFIGTVLHHPEIIILDEPLSGFDPLNVELILNEVRNFKLEGRTVIYSTHNMNSVDELCDEVALLNHGSVVAHDRVMKLRLAHKSGNFKVRFQGSKLSFAHGLWTWFELLSCTELNDGVFEAEIKSRGDYHLNHVFERLSDAVQLQKVEEQLPGMQDVFIKLVKDEK
jgi:ABC-2 type transport system ATP-binding protein